MENAAEHTPVTPAIESALKILENRPLLEAAVKDAVKQVTRDVLTIAAIDGPIHKELHDMVERSQMRLDAQVREVGNFVRGFDGTLRVISERTDKQAAESVERWISQTPDAVGNAVARAVEAWLNRYGRRFIIEALEKLVPPVAATEPDKRTLADFLETVELSARAWHVMQNWGKPISWWLGATPEEMRRIKNCGGKTVIEITAALDAWRRK